MTTVENIQAARKLMGQWARLWKLNRKLRDKLGMAISLERAIIWRETANTMKGQP